MKSPKHDESSLYNFGTMGGTAEVISSLVGNYKGLFFASKAGMKCPQPSAVPMSIGTLHEHLATAAKVWKLHSSFQTCEQSGHEMPAK